MLTRKDFAAAAAFVLATWPNSPIMRRAVAGALVRVFGASNPAFDSARFYRACEVAP